MYRPHSLTSLDAGAASIFFNSGGYKSLEYVVDKPRVKAPLYELTGGTYYNPYDELEDYAIPLDEDINFLVQYIDASTGWHNYAAQTRTLRNAFLGNHVQLQVSYSVSHTNRLKATCVCTEIEAIPLQTEGSTMTEIHYRFHFRQVTNWTTV